MNTTGIYSLPLSTCFFSALRKNFHLSALLGVDAIS
uniref:Uncharacterized protein n=1 Tax=Anguilla anguilla TaxID=7936 RepID=A0A0E9SKF3_ANGAN